MLGRMLANLGWLLGGKGFGAVCSLVYLAILTRTLGLKDFGHFSLIFGTSQALIAVAGFQTWRVVVRFGAEHVHDGQWDRFGRLSMLAGVLDVVGAMIGCGIAYLAFYQFADMLGLNKSLITTAFWFNVASLWALRSAPTGVVRALDRFDMAIYVEAVVPLGRLLAAVAIWLTGPSLVRFLIAWAAIDLLEAALYWILARRLCPQAIRLSRLKDFTGALKDNPGVVKFFIVTFLSSTLEAAYRNGPLLAVGYLLGTRAAGLYRLAQQLAQGLAKFSTLLARAAYAEISRARVTSAIQDFRKLIRQTSVLAGGGSAIVVLIVVLAGRWLLELLGGEQFSGGEPILIALVVGASFELASVAFEPVLHSTGKAKYSLAARLVAVGATAAGILAFVPVAGAQGAAWGVATGGAVLYFTMGLLTFIVLRRLTREDRAARAQEPAEPPPAGP
ncbi:teichoic acid transporter [Croceicoccus mobilis]|uniref:Teichoic acid transporter n=2 Tax=Croceicoccus mobilis TaxID=1703339 RepID=A0A917DXP9_9SPHN|nr:teichoic acid transporter [Croceicoccus mobilis]